jgi:hypothetical protein
MTSPDLYQSCEYSLTPGILQRRPRANNSRPHRSGTLQRVGRFSALLICVGLMPFPAAAESPQPAASTRRISQDLVNRQPALIDDSVAGIAAHSAPGMQVYFLGFAGYGDERVFAEEIDLAADRVAARYGTARRSLRLVNDHRDAEKYPFATVASLKYALDALGRVMDDDDVLFLALSSHGSDDATIAISNPGIRSDHLSARQLAKALAHAGIRWRVIVISACYSGSFIDALADERTIVITAAAKDRPSFGCSDDRHLTYFGEGFYRDALPASRSLREAFEATAREITRRETEEKRQPSLPQAFFGALAEEKLTPLMPAP